MLDFDREMSKFFVEWYMLLHELFTHSPVYIEHA